MIEIPSDDAHQEIEAVYFLVAFQIEGESLASDTFGVTSEWPFVHSGSWGIFIAKCTCLGPQCCGQDECWDMLPGAMSMEDEHGSPGMTQS